MNQNPYANLDDGAGPATGSVRKPPFTRTELAIIATIIAVITAMVVPNTHSGDCRRVPADIDTSTRIKGR